MHIHNVAFSWTTTTQKPVCFSLHQDVRPELSRLTAEESKTFLRLIGSEEVRDSLLAG